jgi:hypothetical protein
MATSTPPLPSAASAPPAAKTGLSDSLRVSPYDRVASTIVSLLVFLTLLVVLLFLVFLLQRLMRVQESVPVEYVEEAYGRGDHAAGIARDPEPPGAEELEQLEEPQIEQSLEAVTDVVSSIAANLVSVEGAPTLTTGGSGLGDDRPPGPLGDGDPNIIPRSERWQIQYPSGNLKQYARVLDYFKIELGVIGGGRKEVEYAHNLGSKPTKRTGHPDQEKRLYMTWRSGEMKEADAQLLSQAGVNASGAIQIQFIPEDTENLLAGVERQAMGNRHLREVQKTVFGVRSRGGNYEFYVIDQRYRVVNL